MKKLKVNPYNKKAIEFFEKLENKKIKLNEIADSKLDKIFKESIAAINNKI